MSQSFELKSSARAMHAYALELLRHDPHTARAQAWDPALVPSLKREREAIRVDEGGGGMCHIITELLWDRHGWARMPVTYLDRSGDVICAGHLICILPDGSLLDATADQFGEGHDVRVLTPRQQDYGRYRPEFDEDFNPRIAPEYVGAFFWSGTVDYLTQDQLRAERGQGWWLGDTTRYARYLAHQVKLGAGCYQPVLDALAQFA